MNDITGTRVVLTAIDMSIGQLMVFLLKLLVAAIPAIIILWIFGFLMAMLFAAIAGFPLMM